MWYFCLPRRRRKFCVENGRPISSVRCRVRQERQVQMWRLRRENLWGRPAHGFVGAGTSTSSPCSESDSVSQYITKQRARLRLSKLCTPTVDLKLILLDSYSPEEKPRIYCSLVPFFKDNWPSLLLFDTIPQMWTNEDIFVKLILQYTVTSN